MDRKSLSAKYVNLNQKGSLVRDYFEIGDDVSDLELAVVICEIESRDIVFGTIEFKAEVAKCLKVNRKLPFKK